MKPKSTLRSFLTIAGSSLLAVSLVHADSATWNVDVDGNWVDGANWNPAAAPGATSGTTSADVATFGNAITAARAITVDANRNIFGISFNANSSAYNLSGGNLLLTNGGTIQTSGVGSNNTSTISSPISLQGDGGTAFITGGTTNNTRLLAISGDITGVSTGINVTTLTLNGTNTGGNAISGAVGDGSGGGKLAVVKSGAGTWNLSNASNGYSGGTTVNAGQLRIAADGSLGDASQGVTFGGNAALLVSANNVTLAATRTITVNSGVAAMGDINIQATPLNFTINGIITGAGGAQFGHYALGSGVTNLTNTANDFTGPLILGRTSAFGSWLYANFTLNIASLEDDTGYGNIVFGQGNGAITNSATLAWSNSATAPLVLDHRRVELNTTVEQSVFANNNSNAARTVTVNTDLLVSRAGNKTFTLGGSNTGANAFNGLIADRVTPAAVISLSKTGAGRWILGDENTYSGVTTVSGGVLVLNSANALPGGIGTVDGTSALTLSGGVVGLGTGDFSRSLGAAGTATAVHFATGGGGWAAFGADRLVNLGGASADITWATANTGFNGQTLILGASGSTHTVTLVNGLDLGTAARTVQVNNGNAAVDGELSGVIAGGAGGALTKTGTGTLSLSNANLYTGATTVSAGVLKLDDAAALPGGTGGSGTSNLTFSGGVIGLTADSGNFTRSLGTGVAQVRWSSGSGGFAAFGGNRNANIGGSGATLQWNASNFIPTGQRLILSAGGSDSTITFANNLNFAGAVREIQVDNGTAAVDAIISGQLGVSGGQVGGLTKSGSGTLALTNNSPNSYTGATNVNAGTLQFGNGGTNGALDDIAGTFTVASGATVAVNRSNDFTQAADLNGRVITGEGSFVQAGTGSTTLSAANTYTGTTAVNAGTLVITGATQATGAITVAGGATLGLDIASPVTAADAAVTLGGSVLVTGTPEAASYTLLTADSISGTPALASPVPGYVLQVFNNNELRLVDSDGSLYQNWSGGAAFDGDANGDGVSNGLAFLLGAVGPNDTALGLLPAVTESGGDLILTFDCLAGPDRGTALLKIQHSNDLGQIDVWTSAQVPGVIGNSTVGVVEFAVTDPEPEGGLLRVVATIPDSEAENGKLFGRLIGNE